MGGLKILFSSEWKLFSRIHLLNFYRSQIYGSGVREGMVPIPPPPHWMQKKKRATIDSSKSLFNPINIPNVQLRFSLALWKCTLEEGNDFVHVRSSASGTIAIVKRGCFEFKNWDEVYNCSFLFQFFYIQNFQLRYVSSVRNDETLPN